VLYWKHIAAFCLLVTITALCGCSFSVSTANLSSLKMATDKEGKQESSTFKPEDTFYALAVISNNPGKVSVKGRIHIENMEGEKPGPIPTLETTVELNGSGVATFTYSPPQNGWPAGKYKMEALMLNEQGEQKDQKSMSFTIE